MKKDLTWVHIMDSFKKEGCPLCFLTKSSLDRYLDSFLYESVNDPGIRKELHRTGGFCNAHAWQLTDFSVGRLGIAILYQNLVNRTAERLSNNKHNSSASQEKNKLGSMLKKDKSICPACKVDQESEKRYTKAIVDSLDDEGFFKEYADSGGLCLPHFNALLRKIDDSTIVDRLTEVQREKLSSLDVELGEFIRKHDHRFSHEGYGPERDSWRRAIEKLVGKREVF